MSSNYTVSGFWRGWHASFNKWLVRYIYVPLGGRERKALNAGAVFLFVALWHELSLALLAWGGLNALFMACESAARRAIARSACAADLQARAPFVARPLQAEPCPTDCPCYAAWAAYRCQERACGATQRATYGAMASHANGREPREPTSR